MNYDGPRQTVDGGWHYTTSNRRTGTRPIGYCQDHEPHPTEAQARECYGQYLRDNVRLDDPHSWSWSSCDYRVDTENGKPIRCENPANSGASVPGRFISVLLCDEHFTIEHATQALGLNGPAGDSWHS